MIDVGLFDRIAPIYAWFFDYQVNYYKQILNKISSEFDISQFDTILDLGCGTGALCKVLNDNGVMVTGIDTSSGMLKQAKKKTQGHDLEFIQVQAGKSLPFDDKSFDLVIASYVAHGLEPEERIQLYKEMGRIAKEYVIIYDYNKNRGLVTTLVEWLENGDYFNFIKNAEIELEKTFNNLRVIQVDKRASWYICLVNKPLK